MLGVAVASSTVRTTTSRNAMITTSRNRAGSIRVGQQRRERADLDVDRVALVVDEHLSTPAELQARNCAYRLGHLAPADP
jgi:hypothetical protein